MNTHEYYIHSTRTVQGEFIACFFVSILRMTLFKNQSVMDG
jgi:hypothetical protein